MLPTKFPVGEAVGSDFEVSAEVDCLPAGHDSGLPVMGMLAAGCSHRRHHPVHLCSHIYLAFKKLLQACLLCEPLLLRVSCNDVWLLRLPALGYSHHDNVVAYSCREVGAALICCISLRCSLLQLASDINGWLHVRNIKNGCCLLIPEHEPAMQAIPLLVGLTFFVFVIFVIQTGNKNNTYSRKFELWKSFVVSIGIGAFFAILTAVAVLPALKGKIDRDHDMLNKCAPASLQPIP